MTENKPPVQQNPNPSDKKKKKSAAGLIILIICIVLTALFTLLTVLPHPSLSDSDDMISQDTTSSNQGIFASMLFGSQKEKKVVPTGDYRKDFHHWCYRRRKQILQPEMVIGNNQGT